MHVSQKELKYLRSLSIKKIRDEERKFLLEGWKALHDALSSDSYVHAIYTTENRKPTDEQKVILSLAASQQIPIQELSEIELHQITDTVTAQGVVAVVEQQEKKLTTDSLKSATMVVALDEVSDPGNVGTILRTCDWFGVHAVLLGNGCASLYNEKVVRSTSGSIFHLPIYEDIDLPAVLPNLRTEGFSLVTTVLGGTPLTHSSLSQKTILVFGNEARGVSDAITRLSDQQLSIPKYGLAESLNVGIACAVFLAQWRLTD